MRSLESLLLSPWQREPLVRLTRVLLGEDDSLVALIFTLGGLGFSRPFEARVLPVWSWPWFGREDESHLLFGSVDWACTINFWEGFCGFPWPLPGVFFLWNFHKCRELMCIGVWWLISVGQCVLPLVKGEALTPLFHKQVPGGAGTKSKHTKKVQDRL